MIPDEVIIHAGTNMLAHTDMVPLEYVRQALEEVKKEWDWAVQHAETLPITGMCAIHASTVLAMQSKAQRLERELEEARVKANRYQWLKERIECADFEYGSPPHPVLIFAIPTYMKVSGDLDKTIDQAIAEQITDNALRGE